MSGEDSGRVDYNNEKSFAATYLDSAEGRKSDPVNHPQHYNSLPSGVECIDVVQHMNFCRGNAIKYIWRAGLKGDAVTDLRKAIWYLECEVNRLIHENHAK